MPVTNQTPVVEYTANGSVTSFPFPFRVIKQSDLLVYSNGTQITTGFTVSGINIQSGGTVTFAVAPASGVIRLQRVTSLDRTTDYVEGGQLAADTLDNDFDRLVMMVQDINNSPMVETPDGAFDAEGKRIKNVGEAIAANDAVTKQYHDGTFIPEMNALLASTTTQASNAEASASASSTSATASANSATDSANSATASANSASAAALSAIEAAYVSGIVTTSTGSIKLPHGTTAQRDAVPAFGYARANETLNIAEWWNGTAWVPMGGGATGGAGNYAFFENDIAITANYTITTNKNAMSAGPITINNGVDVSVPNGSVWSIV